jgi:predicted anti-sigma-YlaC factor YlaD
MITCRDLVELLMDLDSDQLSAEWREAIEQHLGRCSQCLAYVESYRTLVEMIRRMQATPLPARLEQRLQTILRENGKGHATTIRGVDQVH